MSESVLVLPRTYGLVVRLSEADPEFVLIEQPDVDDDMAVMVHVSQVDALIGALQRIMANEEEPAWTVKTSKQCSMLLDVEQP